jgi:hypothetical protein
MEGNGNGIEPFFPVTFNPSRRADFCVQRNTASCVLSTRNRFPMLKTTCPLQAENTFRSQGFVWIKNGLVMNENNNKKQNKGGRTPKTDPSIHRHVFL